MALEPATYLRDHEEEDTKGIVIIDRDGENYLVTENRDGEWCAPFWMPRAELLDYETELVGELTDEQFRQVRARSEVEA